MMDHCSDETDSFSDCGSLATSTDHSSSTGSLNQLGARRGSACRTLHPLPTILQTDLQLDTTRPRQYIRRVG